MEWVKNNTSRLFFIVLGFAATFVYVFELRPPEPSPSAELWAEPYATRWLAGAAVHALVISGSAFLATAFSGWFSEDTKKPRHTWGLFIGFLAFSGLLVVVVLDWIGMTGFYTLFWILTGVAFVICIVDALLGLDQNVIEIDLFILLAILLTWIFMKVDVYGHIDESFKLAFHSGAAAFEIIIANLLFDPREYWDLFN